MLIGNKRKATSKSPAQFAYSIRSTAVHFETSVRFATPCQSRKIKISPSICECTFQPGCHVWRRHTTENTKNIYEGEIQKRRWYCGSLHNGNCTISIFYCILHFGCLWASNPAVILPAGLPSFRDLFNMRAQNGTELKYK